MSPADSTIDLLKKWQSVPTRIKVVFWGTFNVLTFTLEGVISEVTDSLVVVMGTDGEARFAIGGSARISSGSPKGNGNISPLRAPILESLRFKEIDVVEFFLPLGDALLFPVLDLADAPRLIM